MEILAKRTVDEGLHERFAAFCGDRNPMHMDEVAARRTQAGMPVVHGVHSLLWALDAAAARGLMSAPVARVKAKFLKWVYLGDETAVQVVDFDGPLRLQVEVAGLVVLSVEVVFGEPVVGTFREEGVASPGEPLKEALDLSFAELEGRSGEAYVASRDDARAMFPHLAGVVGAAVVAEIAACSYIVGMEAPGLHSMFSKLDLNLARVAAEGKTAALRYEVSYLDTRFRKARIGVAGSGIEGTLDVFIRVPPVQQAGMNLVAQHVMAGEFAGINALIIGGSRGLGELTAKLIAAGGGSVTVTYALGRVEAEKVVGQIVAWGGDAAALAYDVRKPSAEQVAALDEVPTHLFYFATNTIYRPKPGVLSAAMLAEFTQFYVQGFYDLCLALVRPEKTLGVFYPSTVFIDERPAGMTEYAMVKAAGEQLCADMNSYVPGVKVLVHRLPKLPTDQTAGVIPERETDALEALLPQIRKMMVE